MTKKNKLFQNITKILLLIFVLTISSLNINAVENGTITFFAPQSMQEDLGDTPINIKLYQIAKYDNGTYETTKNFKTINLKDETTNIQTSIEKLLKDINEINPTYETNINEPINIEQGYYYYVVENVDTDAYKYDFENALVSIPYTDSNGSFNNTRTVYIKGLRVEQDASIKITKTLDSWNETSNECTFVFNITATKDNKTVYSNVASISFNKANNGSDSIIVSGIPVGSTVTVNEIYSGGYTQTSVTPDPITIVADNIAEFNFNNTYDSFKKSYGVENQFTRTNEDSDWTWIAKDIKGNITGGNN